MTRGDVYETVARVAVVPVLRDRLAAMNLPSGLAERIVNPATIRTFYPRSGDRHAALGEFWDFCEHLFASSPHVYWWPYSESW